ncbi:hypothetical protein JCM30237_27280 [Halolamina litorea]|jgi:hypothetical protein|uniref:Uncharacterized protein n=1 Tax=Halolamina litorea TaxID=1515593 RepID=A0ABD6BNZ4_9EURY|nr:hypothetical protein [Halolamina litorea]
MFGYYDYVLALIPGVLVGVTTVLSTVGLPPTSTVLAGGTAAALVVAHALFVRAPAVGERATDPPAGRTDAD